MSEVTRFRIARPPVSETTDTLNSIYYPDAHDQSIFICDSTQNAYLKLAQQFLKHKSYIGTPVRVVPPCVDTQGISDELNRPHPQAKLLFIVARFLAWLESAAGE